MSGEPELTMIPRDLYYHEVTYVRGLEADNERLRELIRDALDDEVVIEMMPKWCDEARAALEQKP